jgi:hypothetical protein
MAILTEDIMLKTFVVIPSFAVLTAATFIGLAVAGEQMPNLSGTYKCGPDKKACQWSGMTFTVTQKGAVIEAKNEKNDVGSGTLTSPVSVSMGPPWNMLGTIAADAKTIDWTNGTQWKK